MKIPWLIFKSMRFRQWPKNAFVFAGVIFSHNLGDTGLILKDFGAFVVFCLLSGAVYLINDCTDKESDSRHPVKSKRPVASGMLPVRHAIAASVVIAVLALILAYLQNPMLLVIAAAYILLFTAYSLFLKQVIIIDLFIIASGFLLRVVAGTTAIGVMTSPWLLLCTFLLALFLALGKRKAEVMLVQAGGFSERRPLHIYDTGLLDQMIAAVTASTVVCYALYTMADDTIARFHTHKLIATVPFVMYGIFRYLYCLYHKGQGGSPENILTGDIPFFLNIVAWVCVVVLIIYWHH